MRSYTVVSTAIATKHTCHNTFTKRHGTAAQNAFARTSGRREGAYSQQIITTYNTSLDNARELHSNIEMGQILSRTTQTPDVGCHASFPTHRLTPRKDATLQRILGALGNVEEVRKICQVPSISLGVLHQGKALLTRGLGSLDPRLAHPTPPNDETLYTLCSISKAFVSASIGILVDEGKLDWSDPVGKYLPDFKPRGDARVATEATFNDFLRHSGGLSNPVITILAQEGKVLVPQRDFIELVNDAPTEGMCSFPANSTPRRIQEPCRHLY